MIQNIYYISEMEKENAWGKSYGKADYPVRDKGEIHLFDLKKFVEEKTNEILSQKREQLALALFGGRLPE